MNITAAYDKTLFVNEASKYCVLRLKTADRMIPEDARDRYKFADHLIRFVAVGYDLPRTSAIKMELDGTWAESKYGGILHDPIMFLLTFSIIEYIIAARIVDIRELEVPYAKSKISNAYRADVLHLALLER